jgi:hypothetical protein
MVFQCYIRSSFTHRGITANEPNTTIKIKEKGKKCVPIDVATTPNKNITKKKKREGTKIQQLMYSVTTNMKHETHDSGSRDSSVGIATRYSLDGPWIKSRWGRDIPQPSRPALGTTQPPVQWLSGLSRG